MESFKYEKDYSIALLHLKEFLFSKDVMGVIIFP